MNPSLNRWSFSVVLIGALACGHAFADDPVNRAAMSKRQAMQDCLEQQKTADVTMSKSQMKRFCKDKMKMQKATGDMPEQPAADAPHNP